MPLEAAVLASVNPDLKLERESPIRIEKGVLAPGETIANGASASMLLHLPSYEELRIRALVTGTTADLDAFRKLAPGESNTADQPATVGLADGTENLMTITAAGEALLELQLTNTGAGPDVTISYVDLFPYFRHSPGLQ